MDEKGTIHYADLSRDDGAGGFGFKYEDAAQCFEKAVALNPNRLMHCVELGRTYAKMGRVADARKFITQGLTMPETEKDDPETKILGRQIPKKLR